MPTLDPFRRLSNVRMAALAILLCLFGTTLAPMTALAFQDETAPAEEMAAEEPVADDGGAAADVGDGGDVAGGGGSAAEQSFLAWAIEASGIFGLILLLISFMMVALIMMNVLQVQRNNFVPQAFIEGFEQRLNARDFQGAYESARADDSLVARVLAAGLAKLNQGYDKAVDAMQEIGDDENMALEHRLSYLSLISGLAPMIGLMGTVQGMIASFRVIATSPTTPKPSELANGISTALFTTIEGLAVAIPAMIAFAVLKNRIARFMLEVGMVSEGLMGRFAQSGRQQGGAAPAAAPAAPQE